MTGAIYRLVFQLGKAKVVNQLMQPEFDHHYNVYPNIINVYKTVDIEKFATQYFNNFFNKLV
ncbi:hypothetical protein J3U57_10540 [Gilliamella sp. B3464]|uniref:hypothetical protein n=1 Tax=unclassified Gilliamella TaxID=2685620 RepID=UPI00226A07DB|nr:MULTISPECIES: hypothetical protein [unclassified Gilliamella]MCX8712901.1 hypothetical protein [Gilliamella sp. B3468]MCX8752004.1 hypothetical protein [Gilliamella sp. B3464]